jgi:hypothetical protein
MPGDKKMPILPDLIKACEEGRGYRTVPVSPSRAPGTSPRTMKAPSGTGKGASRPRPLAGAGPAYAF